MGTIENSYTSRQTYFQETPKSQKEQPRLLHVLLFSGFSLGMNIV